MSIKCPACSTDWIRSTSPYTGCCDYERSLRGHGPASHTLTKRERFAMAAMQGILSSDTSIQTIASAKDHQEAIADLAQMAVVCADKALAELAKEEGQ